MAESQTTKAECRKKTYSITKPFAKISSLIPATPVYSRGTQTEQHQMAAPRIYTNYTLDCGAGVPYSKVPPIGCTTTASGRIVERIISPGNVEIEVKSPDHDQLQKNDDTTRHNKEEGYRSNRKEAASALAYNIMAMDRHELNMIAKIVQKSDFYVNAGKKRFFHVFANRNFILCRFHKDLDFS